MTRREMATATRGLLHLVLATCALLLAVQARSAPASQATNRVITLAPHITELVFAAGGGDKIVATVNSSNYPPEALSLPKVGDGLSINAEQLLTLQPDLVIAWQNSLAMQALAPVLKDLSISVMYSRPQYLHDIPAGIRELGLALHTQDQADAAAHALDQQLATLHTTYASRTPVSVFIEVGTGPLYTLGSDTLTNDAIATCGGVNIFRESPLVAPPVTAESVLAHSPDVVIIATADPDTAARRANYWENAHLPAAQQRQVYYIDPDMLLRPGPRLIEATQELCHYLDRARNPD